MFYIEGKVLMRVIFVGDVVGDRALRMLADWCGRVKENKMADFIIVNAENAAEGRGLKSAQAALLLKNGTDCITLGNHAWGHYALTKYITQEPRIIRPANVPASWVGEASVVLEKDGLKLEVFNLLGAVFMRSYSSPFAVTEAFLQQRDPSVPLLVDFHAEASAEKQAFAAAFDGKIAAVAGTHTHVQTADERILPGGTGFITDTGMTGPFSSVIGMDKDLSVRRFADQLPASYRCAKGPLILSAVCFDIDRNGTCGYIERIQFREKTEDEWQGHCPLPELPPAACR